MNQSNSVQIENLTAEYRADEVNRRDFLTRLIVLTGSMAAAHLLLEKSGMAQTISEKEAQNAQIKVSDVAFPNGDLKIGAYLAAPEAEGRFPGVLVIHENRGLNEHTRDVARRFAKEGFVALAVDGLSRKGGTASMKSPDEARAMIGQISMEESLSDLEAGLSYLNTLPNVQTGKLGSVGFCWGGARSFALATRDNPLKAAVVFYGSAPSDDDLKKVKCPILGNYGETDTRISSEVPKVAETLKALGKSFDYKIYAGAGHAFFNDTGERYDAAAAKDAWPRTLAFLRENLK